MYKKIKIIFIGILSLFLIISMIGCASGGNDLSAFMNDTNKLRVYEIFGMDCPGCHGGLENLISMVPGVVASKANWEKQQLQVVVDSKIEVTDQQIFDAIKEANFTAGKRLK